MKQTIEMEVESIKMELQDVKTIGLKWPAGHDPEFKTGQFITIFWPHKPKYKRAYSLSSCSLDRGSYEITIKRDGKMGTSLVDWADIGDKLGVISPVGHFLLADDPNKHLICIAGGSGVTPFRGFARDIVKRQTNTRLTILYSVRTADDIIFNDEFNQLVAENENIQFVVTCTRSDEGWKGRFGRITPEWVHDHISDITNTIFYACGPSALVDFSERLVLDLSVPKSQLRLERW